MTGSESNLRLTITNLILLVLVLILAYALYRITGGDLSALLRPGTYLDGGGPISKMVGSLRTFGEGLRDMFSGILR